MAVTINSGPIEATALLRHVPETKWRELMLARRDFMAINLSYDCRCLVTFVNDAKLMFDALGFSSVEQMIREGYGLEPAEIQIAVDWLQLNPPAEPVSLDDARAEAAKRAQELDAKTPDLLPAHRPKKPDNTENDVRLSRYGNDPSYALARLRRDRPDLHARVLAGELSANAGMVEAEFRKPAKNRRKPAVERIAALIAKHAAELSVAELLELANVIDEALRERTNEAAQ